GDLGRDRSYRVVVPRLDPHHARLLGRAEPDGKDCAAADRHLAEDVSGKALSEDAVDTVDVPGRLDASLEHGKQRLRRALLRGVLARGETDVGCRAREPLAAGAVG